MGTTDGDNAIELGDIQFTEADLADQVVHDVLKGRYCWANGLGWLRWDGARWKPTPDKQVREALRQWVITNYKDATIDQIEALTRGDKAEESAARKLAADWYKVKSRTKLNAILDLASGIVLDDGATFDTRADLLNCANGVVDLRTGEVGPHDPALKFTKVTLVDYDAAAEHPDWKAALSALPVDVADWIQVRVGQAATGHRPDDDVMPIFQGSGANGKSTLINGLAKAMGEFYTLVGDKAILANPSDHTAEIMSVRGARLAVIEELPEERQLNVTRMKKLSDEQITARLMRENNVTFNVTHSLFVTSNYQPAVKETDHGTWRRLALVRFPFTFDGDAGDPNLRDRIRRNPSVHRAALAWIVAGARRWYAADRVMPKPPEQVKADTRDWREKSDLILRYWNEHLVADPNAHIMSQELVRDFNARLGQQGAKEWGERTFVQRFEDHSETTQHGVERRRIWRHDGLSRRVPEIPPAKYMAWLGVRFRTAADDALTSDAQLAQGTPYDREIPLRETTHTNHPGHAGHDLGSMIENGHAGQPVRDLDDVINLARKKG